MPSTALAGTFSERATKLRSRADRFLWIIVFIVLGGVLLLLALPPIISRIDIWLSGVNSPKIVKQLEKTLEELTVRIQTTRKVAQNVFREHVKALAEPYSGLSAVTFKRAKTDDTRLRDMRYAYYDVVDSGSRLRLMAVGPLRNGQLRLITMDYPIDPKTRAIVFAKESFAALELPPLQGDARIVLRGVRSLDRDTVLLFGYVIVRRQNSTSQLQSRQPALGIYSIADRKWRFASVRSDADGSRVPGYYRDVVIVSDAVLIATGLRYDGGGPLLERIEWKESDVKSIIPSKVRNGRLSIASLALAGKDVYGFCSVNGIFCYLKFSDDYTSVQIQIPRNTNNEEFRFFPDVSLVTSRGQFLIAGRSERHISLLRGGPTGGAWVHLKPALPKYRFEDNPGVARFGYYATDIAELDSGDVLVGIAARVGSTGGALTRCDTAGNCAVMHYFNPVHSKTPNGIGKILGTLDANLVILPKRPDTAYRFEPPRLPPKINALSPESITTALSSLYASSTYFTTYSDADFLKKIQQRGKELSPIVDQHANTAKIRNSVLKALQESEDWRRISRIVTRVAIIALLIYLVQIMVNLYRYNTRLAAFYEARSDALKIIGGSDHYNQDKLILPVDQLAAALSPDSIDYGKSLNPPTQQAVDLAVQAMKSKGS